MESLSFDRAADYYDTTRSLNPKLMAQVLELLTDELRGRGRCLEIGVGTGRLALPLAEEGIPMVGVDLSARMIERLIEKAAGRPPLLVARADATALPFIDDSFGSAFACWVLHLIPDWRRVLVELARVVRPGGVVLADLGGPNPHLLEDVRDRFLSEAGASTEPRGTRDPEAVGGVMRSLGLSVRNLHPLVEHAMTTPEETISKLEAGTFSFTWDIDEEERRRAGQNVRTWATQKYESLHKLVLQRFEMRWRAYDLPD